MNQYKGKYYWTLLIIYFFIQTSLFSQTSSLTKTIFHHINASEGLISNFVLHIFQDKEGLMWFGTREGLVRYDGVNLKTFQHEENDSNSLAFNHVRSIVEDTSTHTLWIGTFGGGLCAFDKIKQRFITYSHQVNKTNSISNNRIHGLTMDNEGNLYIATEGGGLHIFNTKTKQWVHHHNSPTNSKSLVSDTLRCIMRDSEGIIWMGSFAKGLCSFNPKTKEFTRYPNLQPTSKPKGTDSILCLTEGKDGLLYIGTVGGVLILNKKAHSFINSNPLTWSWQDQLKKDKVLALKFGKDARLWVGTHNGLVVIDFMQRRLYRLKNNAAESYSLTDNRIISFCEDEGGCLWVGTWNGGVNFTNASKSRFELVMPLAEKNGTVCNTYSVAKGSNNSVWLGTFNGLFLKRQDTDTLISYLHQNNKSTSLPSNELWSVREDDKRQLWIGQYTKGLCKMDIQSEKFTPYFGKVEGTNYAVSATYIDKQGRFWVGYFNGGLFLIREDGKQYTRYNYHANDEHSLSSNQINCIYSTHDSVLWIATNGAGLNSFDAKTQQFTRYEHIAGDSNSISSNQVASLYEDNAGVLWIATETGGINLMDTRHKGIFKHYTTKDGLVNNKLEVVLADHQGTIWLAGKGITKVERIKSDERKRGAKRGSLLETEYSLQQLQFVNYINEDAIQWNDYNSSAGAVADDGTVWLGGEKGVTVFQPKEIIENHFTPKVQMIGFEVLGKTYALDTDIVFKKHIQLAYHQNFCSFQFAAPDYANTKGIKYQYQLIGINNNWVEAGNSHLATYTNLPAGEYVFMVKAANSDGVWGQATMINLSIVPAYWQTWWFRSGVILLLLAIIGWVFYQRWKRIKDEKSYQQEMEKKVAVVQMKALQAQMDPHFIFNALQGIHQLMYQKAIEEAANYLTTFAKLTRTVLELSREQTITIAEEINILTYYLDLEQLNLPNGLSYTLKIGASINTETMYIPPMILQPFVENCLKHGLRSASYKGLIQIEIDEHENELICIIRDNGLGRGQASMHKHHTSLGTKIIAERLEVIAFLFHHNARYNYEDLFDIDGNKNGTSVTVYLPLLKDD